MTNPEPARSPEPSGGHRRVSAALAIGIIFLPGIFAWFLLRPGYGTRARLIGLAWLAFLLLIFVAVRPQLESEVKDTSQVARLDNAASAGDTTAAPTQPTGTANKLQGQLSEPNCTRTDQTPGWEAVVTNAILTADRYAVANNPRAAFADAKGRIFWMPDEEHPEDLDKGSYSLILTNNQVALAELVPLFDFCTPAAELDLEGELWKVVLAKLDGKPF